MRVPAATDPIEAGGPPEVGEVQNLSRNGVRLRLGKTLATGAPVRVTLRLRDRPPLTLTGTVAWVQPRPDLPGYALGIRFSQELPGQMVIEIADEEHPPWAAPGG